VFCEEVLESLGRGWLRSSRLADREADKYLVRHGTKKLDLHMYTKRHNKKRRQHKRIASPKRLNTVDQQRP